jgi:phosphatidylinositol alpha-1,6-mannosyltransferase
VTTTPVHLIGGSAYSSTGGIQFVNRQLVRELAEAGWLGHAHFLWDLPADINSIEPDLVRAGAVRGYGLQRRSFLRDIGWCALRNRRDLWLCTHVNYALVGLAVNLGLWRRVGVLLHAAELDEGFTRSKQLALKRVGWVLAVSEFTKRKAIKLGVDPARIHVVPNGVRDPCPNWRLGAAPGKAVVLFVGRMTEHYKGQADLLDAMRLLRNRFPDLRLVFVGDGPLAEWKAEAQRRRVDDLVEFAGRIDDAELARRYAGATVFAMPSENEGFGLVYAEAMAHGVPCVGSDRDAAREVIRHGETGYCVPAGNSTALADAIATIVKSPDLRARMSVAARRRFEETFTLDCHRRNLLATLQGLKVD